MTFQMLDTMTPACLGHTAVFQHSLLEEGDASTAAERRQTTELQRAAAAICADCPVQVTCLYQAVVDHDVAGFVAGTTAVQRTAIRRLLGVRVAPESYDRFVGASTPNRPVDHEEVVRLRSAYPTVPLEQLAQRLGCSLSTVKRHLRQERRGQVRPQLVTVKPTPTQVLHATRLVLNGERPHSTRRAA